MDIPSNHPPVRLLLTLCYNGTRYHGWQVQPNGTSIQQRLQDAVEQVTGVRSGIIGCSRTDAGVHARQFCCTTDTRSPLRGEKLVAALNAHLPFDIAVTSCREVPLDFHPRYSATGKQYLYRIWNGPVRNPFLLEWAHHVRAPLDVEAMNQAAATVVGTHDFAAFCAAGSSVTDTVRTVRQCAVTREEWTPAQAALSASIPSGNPRESLVVLTVTADGFLYNMVRILAGTLLEVGLGKQKPDALPAIIAAKKREGAGPTAPAKGLLLNRVFYDSIPDRKEVPSP